MKTVWLPEREDRPQMWWRSRNRAPSRVWHQIDSGLIRGFIRRQVVSRVILVTKQTVEELSL